MTITAVKQPVRLLVMDRDQDFGHMVRAMLRGRLDESCSTDWVGDAGEALRLIEQGQHDVWLIDQDFDRAADGALVKAVVSAGFPPLVLMMNKSP